MGVCQYLVGIDKFEEIKPGKICKHSENNSQYTKEDCIQQATACQKSVNTVDQFRQCFRCEKSQEDTASHEPRRPERQRYYRDFKYEMPPNI